jgi:hypothetical protein
VRPVHLYWIPGAPAVIVAVEAVIVRHWWRRMAT